MIVRTLEVIAYSLAAYALFGAGFVMWLSRYRWSKHGEK